MQKSYQAKTPTAIRPLITLKKHVRKIHQESGLNVITTQKNKSETEKETQTEMESHYERS
ncbi:hypothetical protein CHL67_02485 [Prosthecochloris sp. GSB1]|nr:hypothetical protein CHL67_02485 [Prosthecochloris sp. GSB1]